MAPASPDPPRPEPAAPARRPSPAPARPMLRPPSGLHRQLGALLQLVILAGMVWAVVEQRWMTAFLVLGILLLTVLPLVMRRRMRVPVPPELELVAIVFLFASLFLGNVHGYYERYWWWDVMLHVSSGFLLGLLGFLLVYQLNREPGVRLHMRRGFVALFSFAFAVTVGTLWEILEFAADELLGTNLQRSGLVDTMWDLIVDTLGAAVVCAAGYVYMRSRRGRMAEAWIRRSERLDASGSAKERPEASSRGAPSQASGAGS